MALLFRLLQTRGYLFDNEFVGSMHTGGSLGIDQLVIDRDFVPTVAGWNQHDGPNGVLPSDERLECVNQRFRQTGGPRRVVSRHTEFDRNAHGFSFTCVPIRPAGPNEAS
jgi:hypothetical protein